MYKRPLYLEIDKLVKSINPEMNVFFDDKFYNKVITVNYTKKTIRFSKEFVKKHVSDRLLVRDLVFRLFAEHKKFVSQSEVPVEVSVVT